ncbi:MAG: NERD domain-containing protein [Anaerolineales bacterium]|uniref:nuclease-related domain-containing protein n=1 Tax=Candidatus Villigracilis proximus TaxID=3140683 RepID=UPI0031367B7A|nr:NERD domain-containing protein [Anaerolineales bacterium]
MIRLAQPWPFSPFKGQPMGMLVETKQISIKDLGFAIENAWDERARKAAMVLMLVRLDQVIKAPEEPAGLLHVVSGGRSYAEYKQDQLTLLQGMLFGGLLALSFAWLVWIFVVRETNRTSTTISSVISTSAGIIALVVVIVLFIGLMALTLFVIDKIMNKIDKEKRNYRKGEEGENKTVEIMGQALDGNWSLFRNVVLLGAGKTDLDAVLVGPSGVWVLEVKAFTGEYRNIGEQWEYRIGNRWNLYKKSPSRQAKNNAVRLSDFFKADNISQWVNSALSGPIRKTRSPWKTHPRQYGHWIDCRMNLGNVAWRSDSRLRESRSLINYQSYENKGKHISKVCLKPLRVSHCPRSWLKIVLGCPL